ncbi:MULTISPECIES: HTH domain-containing protein [unclassified Haladaptatus]|uniref:HTH domain-containing protein n=1 Tax=unclassified Haladaptatus TaxID=2622732 RepID=UPI0023E856C5|nr:MULTISPECIES: HTH domain-containing protein [unclassified Haladaptatus]
MSLALTRELEVEVYMRAFVPWEAQQRQREMVETLREYADGDTLADVSVNLWSSRVGVGDDTEEQTLRTVAEIERALCDAECSMEPFFKTRPGRSHEQEKLTLPIMCVLVRDQGEIRGVYPCSKPDGTESVPDLLEKLAAEQPLENLG